MTVEEKLKDYILENFKSVREFVKYAGLPYSTVDGVLKRGVSNSSIGTVLKICKALEISADELANNKIVPVNNAIVSHVLISEIPSLISYMKKNTQDYNDMTVDGQTLTDEEWEIMLNSMTLSVEFVRSWRKRKEERKVNQFG